MTGDTTNTPAQPTAPRYPGPQPRGPKSRATRRTLALVLFILTALGIAGAAIPSAMGAKPGSIGDFGCFYNAAVAMRLGESIYAPLQEQTHPWYTEDGGAWIYPPGPAIFFIPLTLTDAITAQQIWIAFSAVLTLLTVHLIALEVAKRLKAPVDALTITAFACLPTALLWDKLNSHYQLGQTDIIVMLGAVLGLRYIDKRPITAGLALGFILCIKYTAVAFIPYLILRGRFKALLGMAITAAVVFCLPLPFYGWAGTLEQHSAAFAGVLGLFGVEIEGARAALHPLTWDRSVSVPSGFARLAEHLGQPEIAAYVASGIVAIFCLIAAWTQYARAKQPLMLRAPKAERTRPDRQMLVLLEWASIITAVLVFAPQTPVRHLLMMIFPIAVASGLLLADDTPRPRWPLLVALILHTMGLILPPGTSQFQDALHVWRISSGNSLLALILLYTTLQFGLRHANALKPPAD